MTVTLLQLTFMLLAFGKCVYSYNCDMVHIHGGSDGHIMSPNFPEAFPDGPYNCTYMIMNPGGGVFLEFTDFLSHEQYNSTKFGCRERLLIYTDGNVRSKNVAEFCSSAFAYFASVGDTIIVTYEVNGANLFGISGFRAKYSMMSSDETQLKGQTSAGLVSRYVMPYYFGDFAYYVVDPSVTYTLTRVVETKPDNKIAYSFDQFPSDIGAFTIEVRDGKTSESPLVAQWSNSQDVANVYSDTNALFIRFNVHMHPNNQPFLPGSYVSFVPATNGVCPDGYYKCAGSSRCVGVSALCDGYDHCDDNSDEASDDLNCLQKEDCEGIFECRNGGSCDSYGFCTCEYGYQGDRCEYNLEDCTQNCKNGGTCTDLRCSCAVGFHGDLCQHAYECDPPCENGGVCNSSHCICLEGFIGDSCQSTVSSESEIFTASIPSYEDGQEKLNVGFDTAMIFYIVLPIVLFIVVVIVCILFFSRRRRHRDSSGTKTKSPLPPVTYSAVPGNPDDKNVTNAKNNYVVNIKETVA